MVPFKETIQSKEKLIEACHKGYQDYQDRKISKMTSACTLVLFMEKPSPSITKDSMVNFYLMEDSTPAVKHISREASMPGKIYETESMNFHHRKLPHLPLPPHPSRRSTSGTLEAENHIRSRPIPGASRCSVPPFIRTRTTLHLSALTSL